MFPISIPEVSGFAPTVPHYLAVFVDSVVDNVNCLFCDRQWQYCVSLKSDCKMKKRFGQPLRVRIYQFCPENMKTSWKSNSKTAMDSLRLESDKIVVVLDNLNSNEPMESFDHLESDNFTASLVHYSDVNISILGSVCDKEIETLDKLYFGNLMTSCGRLNSDKINASLGHVIDNRMEILNNFGLYEVWSSVDHISSCDFMTNLNNFSSDEVMENIDDLRRLIERVNHFISYAVMEYSDYLSSDRVVMENSDYLSSDRVVMENSDYLSSNRVVMENSDYLSSNRVVMENSDYLSSNRVVMENSDYLSSDRVVMENSDYLSSNRVVMEDLDCLNFDLYQVSSGHITVDLDAVMSSYNTCKTIVNDLSSNNVMVDSDNLNSARFTTKQDHLPSSSDTIMASVYQISPDNVVAHNVIHPEFASDKLLANCDSLHFDSVKVNGSAQSVVNFHANKYVQNNAFIKRKLGLDFSQRNDINKTLPQRLCRIFIVLTLLSGLSSAALTEVLQPLDANPEHSPSCLSHFRSTNLVYERHPHICSIFYTCFIGKYWERMCSKPNTVFSLKHKVCVWRHSSLDDCPKDGVKNHNLHFDKRDQQNTSHHSEKTIDQIGRHEEYVITLKQNVSGENLNRTPAWNTHMQINESIKSTADDNTNQVFFKRGHHLSQKMYSKWRRSNNRKHDSMSSLSRYFTSLKERSLISKFPGTQDTSQNHSGEIPWYDVPGLRKEGTQLSRSNDTLVDFQNIQPIESTKINDSLLHLNDIFSDIIIIKDDIGEDAILEEDYEVPANMDHSLRGETAYMHPGERADLLSGNRQDLFPVRTEDVLLVRDDGVIPIIKDNVLLVRIEDELPVKRERVVPGKMKDELLDGIEVERVVPDEMKDELLDGIEESRVNTIEVVPLGGRDRAFSSRKMCVLSDNRKCVLHGGIKDILAGEIEDVLLEEREELLPEEREELLPEEIEELLPEERDELLPEEREELLPEEREELLPEEIEELLPEKIVDDHQFSGSTEHVYSDSNGELTNVKQALEKSARVSETGHRMDVEQRFNKKWINYGFNGSIISYLDEINSVTPTEIISSYSHTDSPNSLLSIKGVNSLKEFKEPEGMAELEESRLWFNIGVQDSTDRIGNSKNDKEEVSQGLKSKIDALKDTVMLIPVDASSLGEYLMNVQQKYPVQVNNKHISNERETGISREIDPNITMERNTDISRGGHNENRGYGLRQHPGDALYRNRKPESVPFQNRRAPITKIHFKHSRTSWEDLGNKDRINSSTKYGNMPEALNQELPLKTPKDSFHKVLLGNDSYRHNLTSSSQHAPTYQISSDQQTLTNITRTNQHELAYKTNSNRYDLVYPTNSIWLEPTDITIYKLQDSTDKTSLHKQDPVSKTHAKWYEPAHNPSSNQRVQVYTAYKTSHTKRKITRIRTDNNRKKQMIRPNNNPTNNSQEHGTSKQQDRVYEKSGESQIDIQPTNQTIITNATQNEANVNPFRMQFYLRHKSEADNKKGESPRWDNGVRISQIRQTRNISDHVNKSTHRKSNTFVFGPRVRVRLMNSFQTRQNVTHLNLKRRNETRNTGLRALPMWINKSGYLGMSFPSYKGNQLKHNNSMESWGGNPVTGRQVGRQGDKKKSISSKTVNGRQGGKKESLHSKTVKGKQVDKKESVSSRPVKRKQKQSTRGQWLNLVKARHTDVKDSQSVSSLKGSHRKNKERPILNIVKGRQNDNIELDGFILVHGRQNDNKESLDNITVNGRHEENKESQRLNLLKGKKEDNIETLGSNLVKGKQRKNKDSQGFDLVRGKLARKKIIQGLKLAKGKQNKEKDNHRFSILKERTRDKMDHQNNRFIRWRWAKNKDGQISKSIINLNKKKIKQRENNLKELQLEENKLHVREFLGGEQKNEKIQSQKRVHGQSVYEQEERESQPHQYVQYLAKNKQENKPRQYLRQLPETENGQGKEENWPGRVKNLVRTEEKYSTGHEKLAQNGQETLKDAHPLRHVYGTKISHDFEQEKKDNKSHEHVRLHSRHVHEKGMSTHQGLVPKRKELSSVRTPEPQKQSYLRRNSQGFNRSPMQNKQGGFWFQRQSPNNGTPSQQRPALELPDYRNGMNSQIINKLTPPILQISIPNVELNLSMSKNQTSHSLVSSQIENHEAIPFKVEVEAVHGMDSMKVAKSLKNKKFLEHKRHILKAMRNKTRWARPDLKIESSPPILTDTEFDWSSLKTDRDILFKVTPGQIVQSSHPTTETAPHPTTTETPTVTTPATTNLIPTVSSENTTLMFTNPHNFIPDYRMELKERCGIMATPLIIGGRKSRAGQWPWQVSLQVVTSSTPWHRCGGVLIHPRWVLTAAHCVEGPFYGDVNNWRVVMADYDLGTVSGNEIYRNIVRVISHPDYIRTSNLPNDIALLEMNAPVDMSSGDVHTACLPGTDFPLNHGTQCWISGWGETGASGQRENVMNEVPVELMSHEQCKPMWGKADIEVLDSHVCVGHGDTGACYGDSGGPLMCESDGRFFVAGIMSWLINNCSANNFPNVFTRLPTYTTWLNKELDYFEWLRYL